MLARLVVRPPVRARYVTPVPPGAATGLVARVYRQVEREFGLLAPPVALHSPAPAALAASWLLVRESLIADGPVDRLTREVVATAVSRLNECPYCVDVHSTALRGLVPAREATAVASRPAAELDGRWRALVAGLETGELRRAGAGFGSAEQVAAVAAVATTFHYLNRMATVFLGSAALPRGLPGPGRRLVGALLTRRRPGAPGASLDLLPPATPPGEAAWAMPLPHVADALARASAAVADAARWVPDGVRDLLDRQVRGWGGPSAGLGRQWVDDAVAGLPGSERATAALALLTARGGHQVDDGVVASFRSREPGDAALVELTSWASLRAARELGHRLTA